MWIRAARRSQAAFIEALEDQPALDAALGGALALHDFAKRHPGDARLRASLRHEDVLQSVRSPASEGDVMSANVELVRRLFKAVEERDLQAVLDCYDERVEIHEAESLPYGGVHRGHVGAVEHAAGWTEAWGPLQTPAEYRYDASFLEGEGDTIVALFRHRAVDRERGERLDGPEVGVYEIRGEKIVRSQMFHADSAAVARFLENARSAGTRGIRG